MNWLDEAISKCVEKAKVNAQNFKDFPHVTEGGKFNFTPDGVWTGGFFTGVLWQAWQVSNDPVLLERAHHFTQRILLRCNDTHNHDLGFMFHPSAITGWRLTGEELYRQAALQSAHALAGQFNEKGGFIPGWGFFGGEEWSGSVLIDTLMNLPLLVWAVKEGESDSLLNVVHTHTQKALKNHLREDGSVFHVYHFADDGTPLRGDTYQGLRPDTAWSRGQGWAVAGLAMLADGMMNNEYLAASEKVAGFIMNNLPEDGIPLWDYNDTNPAAPKDASAGAISAYGLLRLFKLNHDVKYRNCAIHILESLSASCILEDNEGLLGHSTADLPHGLGIDEATGYGDYYFLKALLLLKELK
ncbi:glycoside hydrolase family 88 protein [Klebsiella variicola]|uniref:glycoside hydrolase family 88 protein n=1 Tax=Klebsiella variicola TaxID=244366 RepID=UPI001C236A6B|nr:glycoside hydrolase family 88 protein [Klebsiella variicola]MBU9731539.1 glycoside hydrolase family 88 protein [Klebsiella variicola]